MSRLARARRAVSRVTYALKAPDRWLDAFARWKLGPPQGTKWVQCETCYRYVPAWRTYSDGRKECIRCAEGLE